MADVTNLIDHSSTYCLNQVPNKPWQNLTMGDHTLLLESDADEQLLLHIGFKQTLKLDKLTLGLPIDDECPAQIILFVNKNNPGFDDVMDEKGVLSGAIERTSGTVTFSLPAVKFNRVDSISIFVSENHGADTTSMHTIKFEGSSVMNTDVSKIHESK